MSLGKTKDPVEIIVLGYNVQVVEEKCFNYLNMNTKYPYILTYFNNFESGKSLTEVWNWLINRSDCEYICLLNNDTRVTPGWLIKLMDTITDKIEYGFVGPSTDNCHSPQKTVSFDDSRSMGPTIEEMKDPISGFCLLFRKSLWEELNGFDERYTFYGQESDFIDRAQQLGYKAIWRKDAFVWHDGEVSVRKSEMDVDAERQRAKDIYWGDRKGK